MLNYEIRLFNAHDPKLKGVFRNKSFKSRGALYLLQKIWNIRLTRLELKEVLELFGNLPGSKQNKLIASVSDYLQSVLKAGLEFKKLWQTVEQELVEKGIFKKGGYMDTLQYMREREQMKGLRKGRKEGRQEGRKEVILNMLKEKADVQFIAKVTGLSVKEIKNIQKKRPSI